MYKELAEDIGCPIPKDGTLTGWAKQGVLMLNTVLTVREGEAHSHRNKGWEMFTDEVIRKLSEQGKAGRVYPLGKTCAGEEKADRCIETCDYRILSSKPIKCKPRIFWKQALFKNKHHFEVLE